MATKTVTGKCLFCGSKKVTKNRHNWTGKQVYRSNNSACYRRSLWKNILRSYPQIKRHDKIDMTATGRRRKRWRKRVTSHQTKGKVGTKRSMLTDEHEFHPLFFPAPMPMTSNCWKLPWSILLCCDWNWRKNTQNLCPDAGCIGIEEKIQAHGYTPVSARAARKRRN